MNFLIMGVKGLNKAKRVLQEITVNLPFKKITSKSFSRAVILFVPSVSKTSQGVDTNCNNKKTRAKMEEIISDITITITITRKKYNRSLVKSLKRL